MRPRTRYAEKTKTTLPGDAAAGPPLPIDGWAVFLDIDGTLLDIADTPGAVTVPGGLRDDLAMLSRRVGGALALVTGRSIAFVDEAFPAHGLPVAGLHGAEWRDPTGRRLDCDPGPGLAAARRRLGEKAADWPGVVIEDKGAAFAAHFRLAPRLGEVVRSFMESLAEGLGEGWTLQQGKSVVEIRPAGNDKGAVVERFMAQPPFLGRRPLAVGDDLTDEAMFAVVNRLGGLSVRVGRSMQPTAAAMVVDSPAAVREWIAGAGR
ncbi:MAG TPA: trehalose-phosphatase [Rhizobiales bacterium]|nr:trehalose-phosphatase [Hyphomicrobiales bacterium]